MQVVTDADWSEVHPPDILSYLFRYVEIYITNSVFLELSLLFQIKNRFSHKRKAIFERAPTVFCKISNTNTDLH